jgi:predicted short-subunit dehydrogenase-like oxidoreductase (DUF2520 family)
MTDRKALYHAAAVTSSGHVTALVDLAVEMLQKSGLNKRQARQILNPLLESTVQNLKNSDAADALTGTFARGDTATVKRHLEAISSVRLDEAMAAYQLLGGRSLKLAQAKGLDKNRVKKIRKLLEVEDA